MTRAFFSISTVRLSPLHRLSFLYRLSAVPRPAEDTCRLERARNTGIIRVHAHRERNPPRKRRTHVNYFGDKSLGLLHRVYPRTKVVRSAWIPKTVAGLNVERVIIHASPSAILLDKVHFPIMCIL